MSYQFKEEGGDPYCNVSQDFLVICALSCILEL